MVGTERGVQGVEERDTGAARDYLHLASCILRRRRRGCAIVPSFGYVALVPVHRDGNINASQTYLTTDIEGTFVAHPRYATSWLMGS